MKTLVSLAVTAALACAPSPAFAQDPPLPKNAQDAADLQCLALIVVIIGMDESLGEQMALGAFYYLGRLEGRTPGVDWVEAALRYTENVDGETLFAPQQRCGEELMAKGEHMIRLGQQKVP
ncbi:hypothetical protein [Brevundimonas sp.]|jgi:hypothetical protein|uniref:hypothetical protein n=1 Tax=Brevundimonas sp. TaxID=1871086 RepID=UPI002E0F9133|nr:hypothetical protein [Brevundimonas sp.]